MPTRKIKRKGKTMYQWGTHGKIYRTKAKADRQGRAIKANQKKRR